MENVIQELRNNHKRYIEEIVEIVGIPSIGPGNPDPEAIVKACDWICERLKAVGLDEVEQLTIDDHNRVIWGRKHISDDLPTVLFYGHYDVMPPDPLDQWETDPFDPQVIDGKIYGRGTADDKGQFLMHINAVEALLKINGTLPVNALFVIEGEEESGSEGLEKLLDSRKELFESDIAIISDSPFFDERCPSICYGLRGIAVAEIKVKGPDRDLHSGNYGGAVANPAEMLARIINDLKDRNGHITIDGFYDDVLELTEEERTSFSELPFDEKGFFEALSLKEGYGEKDFSTLERVWARPTFEVNGIGGGFQDDGNKTIVPSDAFAKVSMRLVPNQDPEKVLDQLENKVKNIAPTGVNVEVTKEHTGSPFLAPLDNKHLSSAQDAMSKAFEDKVYFIRDGASIPIVNSIAGKLGATCLLIGVDVPEGKIHSPNEMLILDNFYKGMETIVYLMEKISV